MLMSWDRLNCPSPNWHYYFFSSFCLLYFDFFVAWFLHNIYFLFVYFMLSSIFLFFCFCGFQFLGISYTSGCGIYCRNWPWWWTSHGMCIYEQCLSKMAGLFFPNNIGEHAVQLCIQVLLRYFHNLSFCPAEWATLSKFVVLPLYSRV